MDEEKEKDDMYDDGYFSLDRRIPVWGIIAFCLTILVSGIVGSYSFYASNLRMSDSVDKLTVAVQRLQDNQIASNIRDVQHDGQIATTMAAIAKLERDVEFLKNSQRLERR